MPSVISIILSGKLFPFLSYFTIFMIELCQNHILHSDLYSLLWKLMHNCYHSQVQLFIFRTKSINLQYVVFPLNLILKTTISSFIYKNQDFFYYLGLIPCNTEKKLNSISLSSLIRFSDTQKLPSILKIYRIPSISNQIVWYLHICKTIYVKADSVFSLIKTHSLQSSVFVQNSISFPMLVSVFTWYLSYYLRDLIHCGFFLRWQASAS